jgi:D-alanyl-D-alanine endopeptidase (penicillin-binding protein 7)
MMRSTMILLGAALIASLGSQAVAGPAGDDPALRSSEALILDATHSKVLYSRNADVARPIASITKLMTALVVVEAKLPLDEELEITEADCAHGKGAASRLPVGTVLSRGELIHLALMASENRAAHALGRNYPGGVSAFVEAMNAKAAALGMQSAHFVDPSGLSSENVASPQDLSRLVIAASGDPTISAFSTDSSHAVWVRHRLLEFHNTDALVRAPDWDIKLQKTGFINEAGRCLVMRTAIEGRDIVIVLLHSFGKNTRVADARRVRRWMESKLTSGSLRAG